MTRSSRGPEVPSKYVEDPELGERTALLDEAPEGQYRFPLAERSQQPLYDPQHIEEMDLRGDQDSVKYRASVTDYLIFVYFSITCFVLGCPLLNSNAVIAMWRVTNTFSSECRASEDAASWCLEQLESAKIALVLYQSASTATAFMGGVLVDTFSASMCLLIGHIMFGTGAYLLQRSDGTRGIFIACVLQGAAGNLVLNSVIPISGLFGNKSTIMLTTLTLCHDLSVLMYPLLLNAFAPDTLLVETIERFFQNVHLFHCYAVFALGFLGTFLLPVDDDGNLMPSNPLTEAPPLPDDVLLRKAKTDARQSASTRVEVDHSKQQSVVVPLSHDDHVTTTGDRTMRTVAAHETEQHLSGDVSPQLRHSEQLNAPAPLSTLRLSKQLRTPQFFIALILSCLAVFQCSFFLNNNQQLLERVGDDGTLTKGFMWILGLTSVCVPISWRVNDNWDSSSSLGLFTFLLLSVNVLAAVNNLPLQWLTLVVFVCGRSATVSTMLTYIVGCFGIERFAPISVTIGFSACFFNLLNIFLDRYVEREMQGDYVPANLFMIVLGIFNVLCVVVQAFFPSLLASSASAADPPLLSSVLDLPDDGFLKENVLFRTDIPRKGTYEHDVSIQQSREPRSSTAGMTAADYYPVRLAHDNEQPTLSVASDTADSSNFLPSTHRDHLPRKGRSFTPHPGAVIDEDDWEDEVVVQERGATLPVGLLQQTGQHRRRVLKSQTTTSPPT